LIWNIFGLLETSITTQEMQIFVENIYHTAWSWPINLFCASL